MFLQLYKLLSVYSVLRLPKRSIQRTGRTVTNNVPAIVVPMPAPQKSTERGKHVAIVAECLDSLSAFTSDEDIDPDSLPPAPSGSAKDNIVYYVAGFVVRKCKKLVTCQTCITQLTSAHVDESYTLLINVKLRGALNWPSKVLFSSLLSVENTVSAYVNSSLSPFMFATIMEEALPSMLPVRSVLCSGHASSLTAEILVYYISTRLHWHAKTLNKDYASRKKAKQNRKKAKLC
jgi:hypothetical protein